MKNKTAIFGYLMLALGFIVGLGLGHSLTQDQYVYLLLFVSVVYFISGFGILMVSAASFKEMLDKQKSEKKEVKAK